MPEQSQGLLFPFEGNSLSSNDGRVQPRLWVKEIAIYRKWGDAEAVRKIPFQPGLNIVWARQTGSGASGHAAGKSTLCRFIRHLLGDTTGFGNDTFRSAFRGKFPESWLAGEIVVDGTSWLVARYLGAGSRKSWCAPSSTLDGRLWEDLESHPFSRFTEELRKRFIVPLGAAEYPGTEKAIEWPHLLQWLTRDQNARYAGLLQWRAGSGETDRSTHLTSADKTNLIRFVLGLVGEEELTKQRAHAALLNEQTEITTELPKMAYARELMVGRVSAIEEILAKSDDHLSDLKFLAERLRGEKDEAKRILGRMEAHDGVGEVIREEERNASSAVSNLSKTVEAIESRLAPLEIRHKVATGKLSEEEAKRQLAKLPPSDGFCSATTDEARKARCPLAPPENRDELAQEELKKMRSESATFTERIQEIRKERVEKKAVLNAAKKALENVEGRIKALREMHTRNLHGARKSLRAAENALEDCAGVVNLLEQEAQKRERLSELKGEIKASLTAMTALRKRRAQLISEVRDRLSLVASHVLEQETHADISFQADDVVPELHYDGDLSSTALTTLRVVLFDLACLLARGHLGERHPGFLIHDSPREADLSADIYRRLFTLVAENRLPGEASFQYIITTTEAPPENLQAAEWIRCELSSATAAQRLLREIV